MTEPTLGYGQVALIERAISQHKGTVSLNKTLCMHDAAVEALHRIQWCPL